MEKEKARLQKIYDDKKKAEQIKIQRLKKEKEIKKKVYNIFFFIPNSTC